MSKREGEMPSFFDHIFTTLVKSATTVVLFRKELSAATGIISRAMAPPKLLGEPRQYLMIHCRKPVWTKPLTTTKRTPMRMTVDEEKQLSTSASGRAPVSSRKAMLPRNTKSAGRLVKSIRPKTAITVAITSQACSVSPAKSMVSMISCVALRG